MNEMNQVKNYLTPDIDVRRGDVLSAWAGIRPLVKDPNAPNTQSLGEPCRYEILLPAKHSYSHTNAPGLYLVISVPTVYDQFWDLCGCQ